MEANLVLGLHQGMGCSSMDSSNVRALPPSRHMGLSCGSMTQADVRGLHQTNQHANPTTALGIGCGSMGSSDLRTLHPAMNPERVIRGNGMVSAGDLRNIRSSMDCDRGMTAGGLSGNGMHQSLDQEKVKSLSHHIGGRTNSSSDSDYSEKTATFSLTDVSSPPPASATPTLGNAAGNGLASSNPSEVNSPADSGGSNMGTVRVVGPGSSPASKGVDKAEGGEPKASPPKKVKEVPPKESKRPNMKKRMDLTLADKVKIVYSLKEPGAKHGAVAKLYGVARSTVCKISQKSEEILLQFETDSNHDRKRRREGKERQVGEELYAWFQSQSKTATKKAHGRYMKLEQNTGTEREKEAEEKQQ